MVEHKCRGWINIHILNYLVSCLITLIHPFNNVLFEMNPCPYS